MATETGISWATHTQNAWWGCTKKVDTIAVDNGGGEVDGKTRVSPGCVHCYAEFFAVKRNGLAIWGQNAERRFFKEKHHRAPYAWNNEARKDGLPHRVFWNSMSDTFEDRRDLDEWREVMWKTIRETEHLTHMLLTKRPENILRLCPHDVVAQPNVWCGTTCEDQTSFDLRWPHMEKVPSIVRFLSCEPLVGPLDLGITKEKVVHGEDIELAPSPRANMLDWVLVGGESGSPRRELSLDHLKSIVAQCKGARIAVHVKQDSHIRPSQQGRIPDELWKLKEFPA